MKVCDNFLVIKGSGNSRKYILTRSAISYGEKSSFPNILSLSSGFVSIRWRSRAIRVLTPDFRNRPWQPIAVLLKY